MTGSQDGGATRPANATFFALSSAGDLAKAGPGRPRTRQEQGPGPRETLSGQSTRKPTPATTAHSCPLPSGPITLSAAPA